MHDSFIYGMNMCAFRPNKEAGQPFNMQTGPVALRDAQQYCRRMARGHYENFVVGSILVPRRVMQHLYNIYAFCRYSDDLADEVGDPQKSLELLREWRAELELCYKGMPRHPIMVALRTTIDQFEIPADLFHALLSAFEQDCSVFRYETFDDLLCYCHRSANPVGRLFLWLFGYRDNARQELSDRICTGLQLANFWQDVSSDFERGRIYIPCEDMQAFGCGEDDIAMGKTTPDFARMMAYQVDRTVGMFESASALPGMLNRRLSIDVELFRRAGLALLSSIRKSGYDVLAHRPTISKVEKASLLMGCILRRNPEKQLHGGMPR